MHPTEPKPDAQPQPKLNSQLICDDELEHLVWQLDFYVAVSFAFALACGLAFRLANSEFFAEPVADGKFLVKRLAY